MKFNVMTFNLRYNNAGDQENAWPNRIDSVCAMIKKHDPDVFGIQEGLYSMLLDLSDRLHEYHWFADGRDGVKEGEFSAVFYKRDAIDVLSTGQFWLSETPEVPGSVSWESAFPRVCTWGHFQFKGGSRQEFSFYNTHLDHISEEAREKGVQLIWETMNKHWEQKKRPSILTGDMNATPSSKAIQFLKNQKELVDTYQYVEAEVGATFHGFKGGSEGEPIDYIFVTKDITIHAILVDRSHVNGKYPSDHYPVVGCLSPPE
jgi:endonuclease/exonuclease/phosphatase family metal-dependent hydrolase